MKDIGWQQYEHVAQSTALQNRIAAEINQPEKLELESTQINREIQFVSLNVDRLTEDIKRINKDKVHDERFNKAQELYDQKHDLESKSKLYSKLNQEARAYETRELKNIKCSNISISSLH